MVDTLMMWIESLMSTAWVYPVVGILIFGDSFIPVLPSEIPLNLVGAWAGARGEPNIGLMFLVAIMCAIIGDNLCFLLGTRLMPYINRIRRGSKTYTALVWVKRNMRRNAGAAIIIARFIPSARLLLTILLATVLYLRLHRRHDLGRPSSSDWLSRRRPFLQPATHRHDPLGGSRNHSGLYGSARPKQDHGRLGCSPRLRRSIQLSHAKIRLSYS